MTFKSKMLNSMLFILLSNSISCQNTKLKIMNAFDSVPVITYHTRTNPDSIIYIRQAGEKINVNLNVEFKGGIDSLNTFCDSLYYNRADYNYREINEYVVFYILFDNNLRIQDIRIHSRLLENCGKYDYNSLFKRILIQTEGKWKLKTSSSKTWYLYVGSHRFN